MDLPEDIESFLSEGAVKIDPLKHLNTLETRARKLRLMIRELEEDEPEDEPQ